MLKFAFFVYLFTGLTVGFILDDETEQASFDFMYAIFKDKIPICTGALVEVSSNILFIATAAHCVHEVQTSRLDVLLKNSHFDHKEALSVHQVIVHPYYMPPSRDYDIALLKIKVSKQKSEDFFSSYELLQLSTLNLTKTEPSSKNQISLVDWNLKAESNNLQTINGATEDRKSCKMKLANYIKVSGKMLCANFESDSVPDGSPLLFEGNLAGVASYNVKGSKGDFPKIFTNVANPEIYSFIKKYT